MKSKFQITATDTAAANRGHNKSPFGAIGKYPLKGIVTIDEGSYYMGTSYLRNIFNHNYIYVRQPILGERFQLFVKATDSLLIISIIKGTIVKGSKTYHSNLHQRIQVRPNEFFTIGNLRFNINRGD